MPGLAQIQARLEGELSLGNGPERTSSFDADLDRAKRMFLARQYQAAEALLRELKDTKYDRMGGLQRFRCLTNLGVIEFEGGNDAEAGRLMLKATEEYPEHDDALTNRAHAHKLLGNTGDAWAAIQAALAKRPDDADIAAAYVVYAPPEVALDTLQERVSRVASKPKAILGLAVRSLATNEHEQALEFIARLKELGKETPDSVLAEARAILGMHMPADRRDRTQDPAANERIRTALSLLNRAAMEAEEQGNVRTALDARLAHCAVAVYLDDSDAIERSLEEANRLATASSAGNEAIATMQSQFALQQGRYARALDYAERALQQGENIDAVMLHAVALLNRNQGADRENARREIRRLIPRLQGAALEQAVDIMISDVVGQRRYELATEAIQQARALGADPAFALAQESRVAESQGDQDAAARSAKDAAAALTDRSSASTRRMIVRSLGNAREADLALDVLRPLAPKHALTTDTRALLAIALDGERDDIVLEWCKELWSRNALDSRARWNYLCLLDRYDPQAALRLTEEAMGIEGEPQEFKALKARRVLIQRRLGVAVEHLTVEDVPPVAGVDVHYVALFVEALICAQLYEDAVEYAYRSVLRFPDDPGAHAALIRSFLMAPGTARPLVRTPDAVKIGCTVQVQEGDAQPTWYSIEEVRVPSLPDVVSVNQPWVKRLLGKRVNETAVLAEGVAGHREFVVKEIESAAIFRFRDSLSSWQLRFPEHPMLEQHQLRNDPVTGDLDLAPILEMLKSHAEDCKRLLEVYRGGAASMSFVAERTGRTLFQTMDYLSSGEDLFVNCVYADEDGLRRAIAELNEARGILLDGTALWTLRTLGFIDVLDRLPVPFGTVQHGHDAVSEAERSDVRRRDEGAALVQDQATATPWKEVGMVLARGKTYSSEALATLPVARREQVVLFAGGWGAHAIAAAKEHGLLLWSDDRFSEFVAKEYFAVRRTWTQAVLFWLRDRGLLEPIRVRRASAELQSRRYTGTFTDADTMVEAARIAQWKLSSPTFERNLEVLRAPTTQPRACVLMAIAMIRACVAQVRLSGSVTIVIVAVLERLKARDRSLRLVQHVLGSIPTAMVVDPLGARQACEIIQAWLRANQVSIV